LANSRSTGCPDGSACSGRRVGSATASSSTSRSAVGAVTWLIACVQDSAPGAAAACGGGAGGGAPGGRAGSGGAAGRGARAAGVRAGRGGVGGGGVPGGGAGRGAAGSGASGGAEDRHGEQCCDGGPHPFSVPPRVVAVGAPRCEDGRTAEVHRRTTERVMDAVTSTPVPINEPIRSYAPGSPERAGLEGRLKDLAAERVELTMTVGGVRRMAGGEPFAVVQPHRHAAVLGTSAQATAADVAEALQAAKDAAPGWRELPYDERAAVLLRAADLLAGPWRDTLNAATMLGQSKTVFQAEIDAACELIDFLRFNVHFGRQLQAEQPISAPGMWNRMDYRPLEGFVLAITPLNFTPLPPRPPRPPCRSRPR